MAESVREAYQLEIPADYSLDSDTWRKQDSEKSETFSCNPVFPCDKCSTPQQPNAMNHNVIVIENHTLAVVTLPGVLTILRTYPWKGSPWALDAKCVSYDGQSRADFDAFRISGAAYYGVTE